MTLLSTQHLIEAIESFLSYKSIHHDFDEKIQEEKSYDW